MTTEASVLDQLAEVLAPVLAQKAAARYGVTYKHDQTGGTPSAVQYSHGPQGLLTFPGVDPTLFNATMGGSSLLAMIPTSPSLHTNPTYYTVTGVRDVSGDEPDGVCDDAPEAGLMKACMTTSVFGRYQRQTPTLDISRLGQRVDRADPLDLRLINDPMSSGLPFPGGNTGMDTPGDVLTNEVQRKFWERNVAFHRLLSRQLWSGTPANNTGAGGYKEMTGLQVLVNTGYVDAETGQTCTAVDSYVRDDNYVRIDTEQNTIVDYITDMAYQLRDRADRSGISPVRWVIAMRPQMFYELTAVWPCSYLTYRCATTGSGDLALDPTDAVRMRDEMRAGKYLLIDGIRYDVVLDDGIPEFDGNSSGGNFPGGCFSSDIYFIPLSVVGGRSVLFLEYFQYNNPSIQDAMGNMVLGRIEGAFLTWPRQTNLCVQWQSLIEPRLVLRTPWLAGRLQNVVTCPIQHTRSTFPDEAYFVNGGKSHRDGPSFETLWSS
jgi:hypothetical protein